MFIPTDNDDVDVDRQFIFAVGVGRGTAISTGIAVCYRSEDEEELVIVGLPFAKTEREHAAMPKSKETSLSGRRKVQPVAE